MAGHTTILGAVAGGSGRRGPEATPVRVSRLRNLHALVYVSPVTLTEAAEYLGMAPATLRHQIKNRRLEATKVGRDWMVSDEEIRRYAATSRGKPGRRPRDQMTLGLLDTPERQES